MKFKQYTFVKYAGFCFIVHAEPLEANIIFWMNEYCPFRGIHDCNLENTETTFKLITLATTCDICLHSTIITNNSVLFLHCIFHTFCFQWRGKKSVPPMETGRWHAFINVGFTVEPNKAIRTRAAVSIRRIDTFPMILAWVGNALIDVHFTPCPWEMKHILSRH